MVWQPLGALMLVSFFLPAVSATQPESPVTNDELRSCAQLVLARETARARPCLDELIRRAHATEDPIRHAVALTWRGLCQVSRSENKLAVPDFEAAAALFAAAGDPLAEAMTFLMVGSAERFEVRLVAAEQHVRQAIAAAERAASDSAPGTLGGMLLVAEISGASPEHLRAFESMGPLLRPVLGHLFASLMRGELATVLMDLNRLDEAERELDQAQTTSRLLGGFLDGGVEEKRGHLRRRQGRWEEARAHYQKALTGAQFFRFMPLAQDDRMEVTVRGHLAELEMLAGHPERALAWNQEALEQARENKAGWLEGRVWAKRAEILLHTGAYGEAEAALQRALTLRDDDPRSYGRANIEADLGELSFRRGDYGRAAAHFERSFDWLQQRDEKYVAASVGLRLAQTYQMIDAPPDLTAHLASRARELAREADFQEAEAIAAVLQAWDAFRAGQSTADDVLAALRRCIAQGYAANLEGWSVVASVLEKVAENLGVEATKKPAASPPVQDPAQPAFFGGILRLQRGLLLARQGDFAAAQSEWQAALAGIQREGNPDLAALIHGGLAGIHLHQGRSELALAEIRQAAAELERASSSLRTDDLLASYFGSSRSDLLNAYLTLLLREGRTTEAFEATERSRARALLQQLGNRRIGGPAGSEHQALLAEAEGKRAQLAAWQRQLAGAEPPHLREILADRERVQRELQADLVRLEVTNPEYAELVTVQPAPLPAIQAAIAPDSTLVSYFRVGQKLHAWVIDTTRIVQVELPFAAQDLAAVETFALAVTEPRGGVRVDAPGQSLTELSRRLYRVLIAPLRPHVSGSKLILVPHGALHTVPFAALTDPATGRYLIEDFTLVHAPSASVLAHLRAKESPVTGRALVFGAPPRAEPGLGELRGAAEEARRVAEILTPGAELCLGAEATEERLTKLASPVDVLHIAAHAVYHPRAAQFSRLVLAPGSEGSGDDGNLEVHELFDGVDWSGVNLVVLSACATAQGERTRGDEIVSLTRAVLYAGSPGVIASLWPIDDRATAELMPRFYQHFRNGQTAAEALRAAQLETLAQQGTTSPFHWAAFTLHGDPQGRWPSNPGPGPSPSPGPGRDETPALDRPLGRGDQSLRPSGGAPGEGQ